jgi:signal transduction histidine kinase/CheY-like chemotaxis protein
MMSARSLRADLLIAAVLPVVVFALAAVITFFAASRIQREGRVFSKLETVASFLADSAEFGILTGDSDALIDPVSKAMADEDIVHVSIYDKTGQLLVVQGDRELPFFSEREMPREGDWERPRSLGSDLYELRQAARYRVESENEMLGFLYGEADEAAASSEVHGFVRIVMSGERVSAEYRGLLLASLATMAVVLVLGCIFALMLSRKSIRGMSLLSAAARRIGRGQLDIVVPEVGGDEVSALARAFNEMGGELREARDEIAAHQSQLQEKVEERTRELNEMRIEAERANMAKSQFLANMSHEIRTPMTAILGYTEVMVEDDRLPSDVSELLHIVGRNGSHLLEIINGVLDLSKIEAGRLQPEPAPTDLARLVVEVASAIRVRSDERGVELRVEFVTPIPSRLDIDPVRVRQALMNLVGNAVKFTREGSIRVVVAHDPEVAKACICVIDTGIGIDPETIPSLFLEFEQGDASMSRRFGGTGLGLAITRRLARMLGGECMLESEPDVGTRAILTFDAVETPGAEVRVISGEEQVLAEEPRAVSEEDDRLPARILYAEDGPDNQRLISHHLRKAGAEVQIAENGRIAVDMIEAEPDFDLVLMDMAMPEMDGYTAAHTMREMGVEIPIIALTAHALAGERDKCIAAGCDGYLSKPIKRAELVRALRKALDDYRKGTQA